MTALRLLGLAAIGVVLRAWSILLAADGPIGLALVALTAGERVNIFPDEARYSIFPGPIGQDASAKAAGTAGGPVAASSY